MEFYSRRTIRTRNPRTCFGCLSKCQPGDSMAKLAWKNDGDFHCWYLCEFCIVLHDELRSGEEYDMGDFLEGADELRAEKAELLEWCGVKS